MKTIFKLGILIWIIILVIQVYLLRKDVDEIKKLHNIDTVTVTTYAPISSQTDSSPLVTASGFKLSVKNPRKHRVIAISRDLKHKLKFGQRVRLEGAGKYDGIYIVEDLMNKRFTKRIDILINPTDKPTMFTQAKLYPI